METLEQCVKSVKYTKAMSIDFVLVSPLLTFDRFYTFFCCFQWWLWTSKCQLGFLKPYIELKYKGSSQYIYSNINSYHQFWWKGFNKLASNSSLTRYEKLCAKAWGLKQLAVIVLLIFIDISVIAAGLCEDAAYCKLRK